MRLKSQNLMLPWIPDNLSHLNEFLFCALGCDVYSLYIQASSEVFIQLANLFTHSSLIGNDPGISQKIQDVVREASLLKKIFLSFFWTKSGMPENYSYPLQTATARAKLQHSARQSDALVCHFHFTLKSLQSNISIH